MSTFLGFSARSWRLVAAGSFTAIGQGSASRGSYGMAAFELAIAFALLMWAGQDAK